MAQAKKAFFVGMIFLGSLMCASQAHAQILGNDLLRYCTSDANSAEQALCIGYLHGVMEGAMGIKGMEGRPQIFELPAGADIIQVRDVVVKFLKENPKDRQLGAVVLVFKALTEAYPPKS